MKKILIVEDLEINIDLLTQILEEDYDLVIARDGLEAVNVAKQEKPDLILLDISLPKMDGFDAFKAIREDSPNVAVIGLSAHAMSGDAEKALAAGFNDYLTKPIDDDLLLKRINKWIGK